MKNKIIYKIIEIILILLLLLTSGFLFYSVLLYKDLEKFYIIMCGVLILYFGFMLSYFLNKNYRKGNVKKFFTTSIISIIFIAIFGIGGYMLHNVYSKLNSFNKDIITYTSALITFDSKYTSIKEVKDSKIGVVNDEEDIELYTIPSELIEKNKLEDTNKIIKYNSVLDLMAAFYDKEVDLIFINGNYKDLFISFEEYSNLSETAIEVITGSKEIEKIDTEGEITQTTETKGLTEPFTILLMGVDSAADGLNKNAAFNGDTLMLITFNPKTLNATMFSIPRDTYVKIACGNRAFQKINTSAYGGSSCTIKTIQNMTGIKIDYYAKINFKGVVDLVNSLGGIEVNVPYSFCEQDSKRRWGSNTVFVNEGLQTLNGEQALALARNRHYPSDSKMMKRYCPKLNKGTRNDFVRGQNQQLVIEGMLNKVKNIRNVNTIMELLDAVSKNIDTNLSTDQILSFYDTIKTIIAAKSIDIVNVQKTLLKGYDYGRDMIYDGGRKTYAFINWKGSLNDIVDLMKINLGLKKDSIDKKFDFSVNKTYVKEIVGNKKYSESKLELVPNFSTYTYSKITSWGRSNGMTMNILDIDTKKAISSLSNYTFVSQSVHERTLVVKAGSSIDIYYKAKAVQKTEEPEASSNGE